MKAKFLFTNWIVAIVTLCSAFIYAQDQSFTEIKGKIVDESNNKPLVFADIGIKNTNIGTITNAEGEFTLKIPNSVDSNNISISYLGYKEKNLDVSYFTNNSKIALAPTNMQLDEISITRPKNAENLVRKTLTLKGQNYLDNNATMTAFYRETIKKRNKNASLSEAVVKIHKQPYSSSKKDQVSLVKARKNTNYNRLDTLALKLQGGPFSTLYTDLLKYPQYIFTDNSFEDYVFTFDNSTQINDKLVYVVQFKQKPTIDYPMYYGKLYIDAETKALTSAIYSLNVEDKVQASKLFVRKKPKKVTVYPTEATYRVNYKTQNGKWYHNYSNVLLEFKVKWKGHLFNSRYTLNSEMAITDWNTNTSQVAQSDLLQPTAIMEDEASGFSDPEFWGEYNIIEPEKSIESAIKKISKKLKKT